MVPRDKSLKPRFFFTNEVKHDIGWHHDHNDGTRKPLFDRSLTSLIAHLTLKKENELDDGMVMVPRDISDLISIFVYG